MLKTTFKLDAICAKLSKGLSGLPPQEEPCTGATLPGSNGSPRYAHHQDQEAFQPDIGSDLKTFHNGDVAPNCSAQLPMVQATENNGYMTDDLPEYKGFIERNGGDDSRCSSPKVLSGASKRKSRQRSTRVATQEADSPSNWDDGSVNSFQDCDESLDSGVVGSHQDEPVNGLDQWEEEQEETADSEFNTQEHNHDENISMQNIPYTNATNHKANNGNKVGQDDPSPSSKETEVAPYKVAGHELRTRNSCKVPIYDESGLSDEDVAGDKASYDPRAIMEYAERSWCNENGTEIEEGLETNGVVCDMEESGKAAQGLEGKTRRRRGRPSKTELVKMVEERDERIAETQEFEEMRETGPPDQGDVVQEDEEEEQVEYVEDLEREEQGEPSQSSASPASPMSTKMGKDGQIDPGAPYDLEGLEAVKAYATDTMKEFLGMYGYIEEGALARDEDLPIEHIRHILELQRRHAEKKRALARQHYQQQTQRIAPQSGADRTEAEDEKVLGSDPRSSAFMKLSSEGGMETKDPSILKESDHQRVAPSHAVLQQLAALHQQLRAEESALANNNGTASGHDLSDAPHQGGQDQHRHHHRHHPLGRGGDDRDRARQDSPSSQQHAGLREHMESLREAAAAEGGMSELCAPPYPGVLAAHLDGKMTNSRMATGKTVKQLIEEQEFMRNLMELGDRPEAKRFSKYDYFIQKLEAGESISKDVPNLRVSKYDSYIRKLKAGQSINKIIGRKVSASQRIRDIISQQIQLKQGGGSGHEGEAGSKGGVDAEAIEAAILESEGLAQREFAAAASAAAAAAAAAASASDPQLHLDPQRSSNYEYFMSKFNKGEALPRYSLGDGVASTSSNSSTSAISPPPGMDDSSIDDPRMERRDDFAGMDDYNVSYEPRDNILKKCLLETGRSDLDSEEGSEKGIKSGTLSTSSSPGLEGGAFNRYIARFGASQDCGRCSYQFKEHYHCLDKDCKFARFTRKEDVIRHYNWHKRRDNSLQHGFMRFSPSDDCRPYYPGCTLNMKNTHYHCMQNGCHKVYTSTSDVLTHENFHKKNFTLLSDGFQRFRATEDCGLPMCSFYGQKTTHFHCRRPGCDFVFKNKCDIEKHKTFHMKDDIYRKDGFRKFSKHEACKFDGCRYSNTLNHFHCIRNGCNFTFTAANQMHSHKRKHERRHRMMEYETGRHFMRSIRPKMKLPLPRVNPTYRSLHGGTPSQMAMGEKTLIMPPCPAIIFKSDPGAASIAERAALAGQSAALGASQTSPLAGQMMALPNHSASRPDVQAIQSSVITSAPSSSGNPGSSLESSSSSGHGAFDLVRSYHQDAHRATPDSLSATSVITNTIAAAATTVEGHHSSDESGDERPMDLQMYDKYRYQQDVAAELDSNDDEDRPTDLSMPDKSYSQVERMEDDEEDDELPSGFAKIAEMDNNKSKEGEDLNDSLNLPIASFISPPCQMAEMAGEGEEEGERLEREEEPRVSPITIKKEPRDGEMRQDQEAWQKYFRRYTANDHCHSACELLYKGHYHCVVEGCGEYFRSKEGVNKHTRYHLMSDEAEELDFHYYQHGQTCENTFKGCPFSPLAHYHCMWSLKPGSYCGEVVHTGSSLMKPHYEKHHQNPELESIRHSDTDKPVFVGAPIDQTQPPKVVLKDQTMKWFTAPPPAQANDNGYCKVDPGKCSKTECPLVGQKHFHCTRSECNFATESPDMLHDHKSNEKLIFDSFRQFSRKLDCRRPGCKYNLLHKHYHCMHQGCQFSFLQIQQMESHGRKHMRRIYGKFFNRPNNNSPTGPQQLVLPILPLNNHSPPGNMGSPPGALASPPSPFHMHPTMVSLASSSPLHQLVTSSSPIAMMSHAMPINTPGSLQSMFLSPPPGSMPSLLAVPHSLQTPNGLIMGGPSQKPSHQFLVPIAPLDAEDPAPSTSNPMNNPPTGLQVLPNFQLGRWKIRQSSIISPPRMSPPTPHKRPLTLVEEDPGAPSGYKRYKRGPLDSSMQERFERFERNVHCGENNCQFAMNTTHYHCRHTGCNYKFAGKTMMYKHAQHHDRVDSIIQDDFQRFKASVSCDRSDCEYTAKNTHFHCLRCPFICTDSGKVPIHRKQHAKTEAVSAAGFKQFTSSETCISADCKYSQKYSHFHCLRQGCMQAVIGMTQMDSHSRKHRL